MTGQDSGKGRSGARYAGMVAAATGAILLGRFLPLIFANASGALRGATGRDPFAGLIREHARLLSLLTEMEATPAKRPIKRMQLFFTFKRILGKHALAEEDIVYPLLETDGERQAAAEQLYREHASMKVHLFELNRSIKDEERWRACVRSLRAEIEPHARQEEEVEFPRLREVFAGRTTDLARRIEQEEALIV